MEAELDPARRPPPEAIDQRTSDAGLRAVATFEALKGAVILALGLGLLSLLHKDVELAVENMLSHLHINPETRFASAILRAAGNVTDARLWGIALASIAYTSVRFIEAYGLWHRRVWAQWFALLSGCLYLPWEITTLVEHRSLFHWVLLLGNLAIVIYMGFVRFRASRVSLGPRQESFGPPSREERAGGAEQI